MTKDTNGMPSSKEQKNNTPKKPWASPELSKLDTVHTNGLPAGTPGDAGTFRS